VSDLKSVDPDGHIQSFDASYMVHFVPGVQTTFRYFESLRDENGERVIDAICKVEISQKHPDGNEVTVTLGEIGMKCLNKVWEDSRKGITSERSLET
jgi:hypothetical protein